jgi:hypothetical protein
MAGSGGSTGAGGSAGTTGAGGGGALYTCTGNVKWVGNFDDAGHNCVVPAQGSSSEWLDAVLLTASTDPQVGIVTKTVLPAGVQYWSNLDFDGDGHSNVVGDLFTGSSHQLFHLRVGTDGALTRGGFLVFNPQPDITLPHPNSTTASGDVDGDGRPDVVLAMWDPDQSKAITWETVKWSGTAASGSLRAIAGDAGFIIGATGRFIFAFPGEATDVTGDGKRDVVGIINFRNLGMTTQYSDIVVGVGIGDGSFTATPIRSRVVDGAPDVEIANLTDTNADGKLDVSMSMSNGGTTIFYGDGTGHFAATPPP